MAELRKLSTYCEFGTHLNDALRDRFVCGLRSGSVQKKLLTETTLTLESAIKTAKTAEQVGAKSRQLQSSGSAAGQLEETPATVGKLSMSQRREGGTYSCYRCGKPDHQSDKCKFKSARCHNCSKVGHIASVCRQKRNSGRLNRNPKLQVIVESGQ